MKIHAKMVGFLGLTVLGLVACSEESSTVAAPTDLSSSSALVGSSSSATPTGPVFYATLPSVANATDAQTVYASWKNLYVRTYEQEIALNEDAQFIPAYGAPANSARVRFDKSTCNYQGQCTVSEGIGYGMLNAYFANDGDTFLRLWYYSQTYRVPGTKLMNWKIISFFQESADGSATDADLDIATALILGYKKWGGADMLADAIGIANDVWTTEITPGSLLIRPGNTPMWDADSRNPSYFSPVAFRLFAEVDPSHDWISALNANYAYMETISANGSGLFPDWTNSAGVPAAPPSGVADATYNKYFLESVRVPYRLVWDYAWYNEPRAKTILTRMANYITTATGGDPTKIKEVYPYQGNPSAAAVVGNMPHKASLCAVGMADPAYLAWLNACAPVVNSSPIASFDYFPHILQVMYAQLLNGLYIKP
jgi:endo-1,4-beta-D-glucanase Y